MVGKEEFGRNAINRELPSTCVVDFRHNCEVPFLKPIITRLTT